MTLQPTPGRCAMPWPVFAGLAPLEGITTEQQQAIARALRRHGLLQNGTVLDTDRAYIVARQLLTPPPALGAAAGARALSTRPHTPSTDRPLEQLLADDLDRRPPTHREQRRLEAWLWHQRRVRNGYRWGQTL